MHATIQIGDSIIMMGDEMPAANAPRSAETLGASPISLFVNVNDADVEMNMERATRLEHRCAAAWKTGAVIGPTIEGG